MTTNRSTAVSTTDRTQRYIDMRKPVSGEHEVCEAERRGIAIKARLAAQWWVPMFRWELDLLHVQAIVDNEVFDLRSMARNVCPIRKRA